MPATVMGEAVLSAIGQSPFGLRKRFVPPGRPAGRGTLGVQAVYARLRTVAMPSRGRLVTARTCDDNQPGIHIPARTPFRGKNMRLRRIRRWWPAAAALGV